MTTEIDRNLRRMKGNKNNKNNKNNQNDEIMKRRTEHMKHRPSGIYLISRIIGLKKKPVLNEIEKIELGDLIKYLDEDNRRETKRLNIKFGLPEDTPFGESHRLEITESKLHIEEAKRILEESKKKTIEMKRTFRNKEEEFKRKMEQMDKDAWEIFEKSVKESDVHYIETTSIRPEENIECSPCISSACPPPLKINKAKKNKLLNMVTG